MRFRLSAFVLVSVLVPVRVSAGPADGVPLVAGRTTTLVVEPDVGSPVERDPAFVTKAPAYRRALDLDGTLRWAEAANLHQQALAELGAAAASLPPTLLEQATLKIEQERRRSRALAQTAVTPPTSPSPSDDRFSGGSHATTRPRDLLPLERGRLLRLKLMAVRAGTGALPAGLVAATLAAFGQALRVQEAETPPNPRGERTQGTQSEVRLLLCATRAAAGDRTGARLELAHVPRADRLDPARAIAAATCQAALGRDDEALASLAVAVSQLGPSSRLLPGQARDLRSANDWDRWRGDPRFERLFR